MRRTYSTRLHENLDVAPHYVEAAIGHVSGHKAGVGGVYNKSKYLRQVKAAMDAWAAHLLAIVEGRESAVGNVVPLERVASKS